MAGELRQEIRDVREAFGEVRRTIREARRDGTIDADERQEIKSDFLVLIEETGELLGVTSEKILAAKKILEGLL
jgi:NTP pyrophosphatase (non-canonical NTP hydrolase)